LWHIKNRLQSPTTGKYPSVAQSATVVGIFVVRVGTVVGIVVVFVVVGLVLGEVGTVVGMVVVSVVVGLVLVEVGTVVGMVVVSVVVGISVVLVGTVGMTLPPQLTSAGIAHVLVNELKSQLPGHLCKVAFFIEQV